MYQINKDKNEISEVKKCSFSELGFREREHVQEWIAKKPSVFGSNESEDDELLIIQKEFDGFKKTRERLDLLALDKKGDLVIIENKLDDSGRDVVWQALKYASYCSTLKKHQIVQIYQEYLTRYSPGDVATELLTEFYNCPYEEISLNDGNNQRLIFVAAEFRPEVTSTVIWLQKHKINIQCFRITPYEIGEQLFLNFDQILPVKETEELMIVMAEKELEQKASENEVKASHTRRIAFWEKMIEAINKTECKLYKNISPSKDHWLSSSCGVTGCNFHFIFLKKCVRVELNFGRSKKDENKFIFDEMYKMKDEIAAELTNSVNWKRLNQKKSSRLEIEKEFDCYDRDTWPEIIEYLQKEMVQFSKVLKPKIAKIGQKLKGS
jgi:hypothetical protein